MSRLARPIWSSLLLGVALAAQPPPEVRIARGVTIDGLAWTVLDPAGREAGSAPRPVHWCVCALPVRPEASWVLGARTPDREPEAPGVRLHARFRAFAALREGPTRLLLLQPATDSWTDWSARAPSRLEAGEPFRALRRDPDDTVVVCALGDAAIFVTRLFTREGLPARKLRDALDGVALIGGQDPLEDDAARPALIDWADSPKDRHLIVLEAGPRRELSRAFIDALGRAAAGSLAIQGSPEGTEYTAFGDGLHAIHRRQAPGPDPLPPLSPRWTALEHAWSRGAVPLEAREIETEGAASEVPVALLPRPVPLVLPPRPASARSGTEIFEALAEETLARREAILVREILDGNFPKRLRKLVPLHLEGRDAEGRPHRLELKILPDVLAVGDGEAAVRAPLSPSAAARIADAFGATLPTPLIVDAIHERAAVRLAPQPLTTAREAATTFVTHDRLIDAALADHRENPGLVAGHKKDLVLTTRHGPRRDRVAIYGWHRRNGAPIQPLYVGHSAGYVDYSHGVRLVAREARLDGRPVDVWRILSDPRLHPLLTREGAFPEGLLRPAPR